MIVDRLQIDVADAELTGALGNAIARLEKPDDLLRVVARTLMTDIQGRFDTETDPNGAPWAPLAASTLKRKKGRGSTLVHTNRMRSSLGYDVLGNVLEVGFAEVYAGYHETGTRRADGSPRMPRRGLLTADWRTGELGAADRQDIVDDVQAYLLGLGL